MEVFISSPVFLFISFPPNSLPNPSYLWAAGHHHSSPAAFQGKWLGCSGARPPQLGVTCPPTPCVTVGRSLRTPQRHTLLGPTGLVPGGNNNERGLCKGLEEGLEYREPSTGLSHNENNLLASLTSSSLVCSGVRPGAFLLRGGSWREIANASFFILELFFLFEHTKS